MPDHVHVLLTARDENAELLPCVRKWRQMTGDDWRAYASVRLWQKAFWETVLRNEEDVLVRAAYIVDNPVRAGLVRSADQFPFAGSSVYTIEQLIETAQIGRG